MENDSHANIPGLFLQNKGNIFLAGFRSDTLPFVGNKAGAAFSIMWSLGLIKRVHYLSLLPTRLPLLANEASITE